MKGLTTILAVPVVIVFTVLLVTGTGITTRWGEGIVLQRDVQVGFYVPIEGLEAARGFATQALRYAEYQACDEVASRGGQRTLDGNSADVDGELVGYLPARDGFAANLGDATTQVLARATAEPFLFLGTVSIPFPAYTVSVQESGASAAAAGRLVASGTAEKAQFRFEREASVAVEKEVHCFALHREAERLEAAARAELQERMRDALEALHADGLPRPGVQVAIPGVAAAEFAPESPALLSRALGAGWEGMRERFAEAVAGPLEAPAAPFSGSGSATGSLSASIQCASVQETESTVTALCKLGYRGVGVAAFSVSDPAKAFPVSRGGAVQRAAPVLRFAVQEELEA